MISPEERKRREKAVRYAQASVELEGFKVSDETKRDAQRFIEGEITMEEFVHGHPAGKGGQGPTGEEINQEGA